MFADDGKAALVVTLAPYDYWLGSYQAQHGSPNDSDAHVPIIFYGNGIKPGSYPEYARVVDMAPTLAAIVRVAPQKSWTGIYFRMRSGRVSLHSVWKAFDEAEFGTKNILNLRESLPTAADARHRAEAWLRERQVSGTSEVLLITGRGNQSPGGVSAVRGRSSRFCRHCEDVVS